MLGYQFIHLNAVARQSSRNNNKQSAKNVAAEIERKPHACPHIEEPQPPIHLYGCSPSDAVKFAGKQAALSVDKIGRKIRKDALILVAGVASYPIPTKQLTPSDPNLNKWLKLTHQFLLDKYGSNYKSLYFHHDEQNPHVHFIITPSIDNDRVLSIASVHDGIKARNEVTSNKAKDKMSAYKAAMRNFQQEYFEKVGKPCGLCKEGPKRRRLTRKEWKAEKAAAERQAEAFSTIKLAENSVHDAQIKSDEIEKEQVRLNQIAKDAKNLHAQAKKEQNVLLALKSIDDDGITNYLKKLIGKLKTKLNQALEKLTKLESLNNKLCTEMTLLNKQRKQLEKQNSTLTYQNNLRHEGINRLNTELNHVLRLASSGQFQTINESYNNNNNPEYTP